MSFSFTFAIVAGIMLVVKGGEHMALIICPECGKEISDSAKTCPGCGYPVKSKTNNKNIKMRMAFGIIDLILGWLLFIMVITSNGGVEGNIEVNASAWLLIFAGFFQLFGKRIKGLTITAIVFYSLGIFYTLFAIVRSPGCLIVCILMIVFLILTSISLKDKDSFY